MPAAPSLDSVRLLPWSAWWPTLAVLVVAGEALTSSEVQRRLNMATSGRTGRNLSHVLSTLNSLFDKGLVTMTDGPRNGYLWAAAPGAAVVEKEARQLIISTMNALVTA